MSTIIGVKVEIIRDPGLLHPELRKKANIIIDDFQRKFPCTLDFQVGIPIIYETWRSPQRQRMLFEQEITKADAWQSWHQYGLALDFVFDNDTTKKGIQGPYKGDFYALGALGIREGLSWGGEWGDLVHFQLTANLTIKEAADIYAELGILGLWHEVSKRIASQE
jgi:hypothetical protein